MSDHTVRQELVTCFTLGLSVFPNLYENVERWHGSLCVSQGRRFSSRGRFVSLAGAGALQNSVWRTGCSLRRATAESRAML